MRTKKDFLVSYDFGKAGLWGLIRARSADEIATKYPELEIVKEAPPFLDMAAAAHVTFDIDAEPEGWLAEMVKERK
ncbi:MAG: hypothetical protein KGJ78_12400 [Alphaproteobacteria bacterium]|nr:hypothetical protein [Alphaproteobacteria bacterium]